MKLWGWGGVVPWIGFRRHYVPPLIADEMGIDINGSLEYVMVDVFEIEWFGVGCQLLAKRVA